MPKTITERDIEIAEKLKECLIRIQHLEDSVKEIKAQIKDLTAEQKRKSERLSDRRLAAYLALASVLGAAIIELIKVLLG